MEDWRDSVSRTVGVERVTDIGSYTRLEPENEISPLDVFYSQTREVMSVATPTNVHQNEWIGSLYFVAIVSCTENYFRNIFSIMLKNCCDSQKLAAANTINLGSVIWHPNNEVERGAFENLSFASSSSIKNTAKKFFNLNSDNLGLKAILAEYDLVCELRHGIVHADRVLAGKNGMKLRLNPSDHITRVKIDYRQLQEVSAVCTTLVVSSNRMFFQEMSKRWATSWRNSPSWNSEHADSIFRDIWLAFHSRIDKTDGALPLPCTWVKCRNLVKKEFDL